jgi:hypothetical protein
LRLASRVAINRTVAGVHFPVDSIAGCLLGLTLGEYFVARCTGAPNYTPWNFGVAAPFNPADDFDWRTLFDTNVPAPIQASTVAYVTASPNVNFTAPHSPLLAYLWNSARREWL